jgi:hypothetical protein
LARRQRTLDLEHRLATSGSRHFSSYPGTARAISGEYASGATLSNQLVDHVEAEVVSKTMGYWKDKREISVPPEPPSEKVIALSKLPYELLKAIKGICCKGAPGVLVG